MCALSLANLAALCRIEAVVEIQARVGRTGGDACAMCVQAAASCRSARCDISVTTCLRDERQGWVTRCHSYQQTDLHQLIGLASRPGAVAAGPPNRLFILSISLVAPNPASSGVREADHTCTLAIVHPLLPLEGSK